MVKAVSKKSIIHYFTYPIKKFFTFGIGTQVFFALIAGIVFGLFLRNVDIGLRPEQFKCLGDIFLDLIKMTVAPLIFTSISAAILSIENMERLGKTASQGMLLFLFSTAVGALTGVIASVIVKPGMGAKIDLSTLELSGKAAQLAHSQSANMTITQKILDIVPDNIFHALAHNNLMQIIFFAVIFSLSIGLMREKISPTLINLIRSFAEVMYAMVKIVMKFAPFGIFGLIVWISGTQDAKVVYSLLKLVLAVILGISMLIYVFYPIMLIAIKLSPLSFVKKIVPIQILALATGSSAATLPLNIKNAQDKIGISQESSDFLMPLGTSLNMNGNACSLAIYTIFVAQLFAIPLGMNDYFTIGLLCFISSMGSPAVPGGAIIMLAGILSALNYPIEALSLILAIDKIIGPLRTAGNVTGDTFASLFVDKINNKLNLETYYKKFK